MRFKFEELNLCNEICSSGIYNPECSKMLIWEWNHSHELISAFRMLFSIFVQRDVAVS